MLSPQLGFLYCGTIIEFFLILLYVSLFLFAFRYFTWDQQKFPHPEEMINNVSAKGRKMVTIVDPHLKSDSNYHVYQEGKNQGFLVKNKDGNDYDGWCWPGLYISIYITPIFKVFANILEGIFI